MLKTAGVMTVVDTINTFKLYRTREVVLRDGQGLPDAAYGTEQAPGVLTHDIPNTVGAIEYERDPEDGAVLLDDLGTPKVALDEQGLPKHGPVIMTWNPTYYCLNPTEEVKRYRGAWLASGGGGSGTMTAHMHLSAAVGHQVVIGGSY